MKLIQASMVWKTAAASLLLTMAAYGPAQAAKAKSGGGCADVAMGLATDDSGLAGQAATCEATANSLDVQKFDGAVAAYNAARANNQRAVLSGGATGGAYYSNATRLIASVCAGVRLSRTSCGNLRRNASPRTSSISMSCSFRCAYRPQATPHPQFPENGVT